MQPLLPRRNGFSSLPTSRIRRRWLCGKPTHATRSREQPNRRTVFQKGRNMQYKTLGNTGLLVSRLCLGTMTFGRGQGIYKAIGAVDQKGADALVKAAIDGGINFFDTADVYSAGESEETLGQSFKNLNIARKDVVLATKVYSRMGPGRND